MDKILSAEEYETPQEKYLKETNEKTIWLIPNHTHTYKYVEWIKNYIKKSNSIEYKIIREFVKKNKL